MKLALSTHWNAFRHASGEAMVQEILDLGFNFIELGYDLRPDLVPGVMAALRSGALAVSSVHAFCPVPTGVPQGHPELFALTETDRGARESAIRHMQDTIRFAAGVGAATVVAHAGRVDIGNITSDLIRLAEEGRQFSSRFDRLKVKLILRREKKAGACVEALRASVEALLPLLDECGVNLALENLPSLESVPSEHEMEELLARFDTPRFGYWHDTGHALVRQRLGFAAQRHTLQQFRSRMLGMHAHSVAGFANDHLMPPGGELDTDMLAPFAAKGTPVVLEPAPGTPPDEVAAGARILREKWADGSSPP
jgi:sugar phosphate isomerase/epimerase